MTAILSRPQCVKAMHDIQSHLFIDTGQGPDSLAPSRRNQGRRTPGC